MPLTYRTVTGERTLKDAKKIAYKCFPHISKDIIDIDFDLALSEFRYRPHVVVGYHQGEAVSTGIINKLFFDGEAWAISYLSIVEEHRSRGYIVGLVRELTRRLKELSKGKDILILGSDGSGMPGLYSRLGGQESSFKTPSGKSLYSYTLKGDEHWSFRA